MPQALPALEASRERALREIEATRLEIEAMVRRVDRALSAVEAEPGAEPQHRAALARARRDLEDVKRRIHQDAFLHSDLLPLE